MNAHAMGCIPILYTFTHIYRQAEEQSSSVCDGEYSVGLAKNRNIEICRTIYLFYWINFECRKIPFWFSLKADRESFQFLTVFRGHLWWIKDPFKFFDMPHIEGSFPPHPWSRAGLDSFDQQSTSEVTMPGLGWTLGGLTAFSFVSRSLDHKSAIR